ncbi:MAG: 6-phosphofructokinase, partial [Deltaproteobacteria bacterium]|nr:6-phosphofructokinase [Deltaproteobacteria bacterium]
MGREVGWIALMSGIAGGADVILIPEIPYDVDRVIAKIGARSSTDHSFSIIVVAEGAKPLGGTVSRIGDAQQSATQRDEGPGVQLAQLLEGRIDHEVQATVLVRSAARDAFRRIRR